MIVKTLDSNTLDLSTFLDADLIRVGEAYARLLAFCEGSASVDTFACDAGTYSAVRRAAARIVGIDRDRSTEAQWSRKPGTKQWKRVKRGATVPTNHERKTTTVRGYSGDAVRQGIETLRESRGVAVKRQATRTEIDGTEYIVVALVRQDTDTDTNS